MAEAEAAAARAAAAAPRGSDKLTPERMRAEGKARLPQLPFFTDLGLQEDDNFLQALGRHVPQKGRNP